MNSQLNDYILKVRKRSKKLVDSQTLDEFESHANEIYCEKGDISEVILRLGSPGEVALQLAKSTSNESKGLRLQWKSVAALFVALYISSFAFVWLVNQSLKINALSFANFNLVLMVIAGLYLGKGLFLARKLNSKSIAIVLIANLAIIGVLSAINHQNIQAWNQEYYRIRKTSTQNIVLIRELATAQELALKNSENFERALEYSSKNPQNANIPTKHTGKFLVPVMEKRFMLPPMATFDRIDSLQTAKRIYQASPFDIRLSFVTSRIESSPLVAMTVGDRIRYTIIYVLQTFITMFIVGCLSAFVRSEWIRGFQKKRKRVA